MNENMTVNEVNELWKKVAPRLENNSSETALARPAENTLPSVQPSRQPLESMLNDEWDASEYYRLLAKKSKNRDVSALYNDLVTKQQGLVKKMATMYYLRYGFIPKYPVVTLDNSDFLGLMRKTYIWELTQAQKYREAFETVEPSLKEISFDAAQQKDENAEKIHMGIENEIGKELKWQ